MTYTDPGSSVCVRDACGFISVDGVAEEMPLLDEKDFYAVVEAGVRRMVLRDEDHAAQLMGRAILWARAQKEGA